MNLLRRARGPSLLIFSENNQSFRLGHIIHQKIKSSRNRQTTQICAHLAISATLAGFCLQFHGLKAIHSADSVFYLSCLFVMDTISTLLSSNWSLGSQHRLYRAEGQIRGHELNWSSLHMGDSGLRYQPKISGNTYSGAHRLTVFSAQGKTLVSPLATHRSYAQNGMAKTTAHVLCPMYGFASENPSTDSCVLDE